MSVITKPCVELGRAECADAERLTADDWWIANGLGGYAGGTVSGILSRRYHGLLTASTTLPLGRKQLMVKADASLLLDDHETPLYTNQWHDGEINPHGYLNISRFYLDGNMPVWHFRVGDVAIEQRIWMPRGKNQTCIAYRLVGAGSPEDHQPLLKIDLIAGYRDHHSVSDLNSFDINTQLIKNGLHLHYPEGEKLHIYSEYGELSVDNTWVENFHLHAEHERGFESIDHHLRIGQLELPLSRDWRGLVIGTELEGNIDLTQSMLAEYHRMADLLEEAFPGLRQVSKPAWVFQLVAAADSFLFERVTGQDEASDSIIAGFPWFGDWGRDTMVSLPGLCLATGRYDVAWRILTTFSEFVNEGMLPNTFVSGGKKPEYNSVDASLWYIEAWRAYLQASGDIDAVDDVLPLLEEIIFAYSDGTRFGISVDPDDGLLMAGIEGQQLTWMDARVDGIEVTPRHGKPVEVNALWYNALQSMINFCEELDQPVDEYQQMAEKVASSFKRFVREDGKGLYDVLDGPGGNDGSIRPNQIIALSLTYSPLSSSEEMQAIIDTCQQHLLTPYGLRSLAPSDGKYVGFYEGGAGQRDASYHQGTVWAWLLGHYALAEYRVTRNPEAAQKRLDGMQQHLRQAGLGQISEIFDGDIPHVPRGAPAQAWSVACTLEAWWKLERAKL